MSQNCIAVQGTNDSSIVSKCSMVCRGYFQDDFVKCFVARPRRRSPLINRGYYIRAHTIQTMLERFYSTISCSGFKSSQVISLGSGFDSSYFRLKQSGTFHENDLFVEIDFPDVLKRKLDIITHDPVLTRLAGDKERDNLGAIFMGRNYIMLGLDLKQLDQVESTLKLLGVDFTCPTLFVSECVLSYMDTASSDALISWCSRNFYNASFVMYEQVYPDDGFGCIMMKHFKAIGSPLKSLHTYSSISCQHNRFIKLGWASCNVKCANCLYNLLSSEEHLRISKLEMFDEYEEFHLKCSHYLLVHASQGILASANIQNNIRNCIKHFQFNYQRKPLHWTLEKFPSECLTRFGHAIGVFPEKTFMVFGGFSEQNGKHYRPRGVHLLDFKLQEVDMTFREDGQKLDARMHSAVVVLSDSSIFVFGGRSSPARAHGTALITKGDSVENGVPEFTCVEVSLNGQIPCSRWRHTCVTFSRNGRDRVVVFGGRTPNAVLGDCFILNVETWTWTEVLSKCLPTARHSHAAVSVDDSRMIVTGGLDEYGHLLDEVYEFNFEHKSWKALTVSGMLPRYSHTAHAWNGFLILIGGVNSWPECLPGVAVIDLTSLCCREFKLPEQDPHFPLMLHNHCSFLREDERVVVVVGGGGNCFSFGTHFNTCSVRIPLTQFLNCDPENLA